MWTLRTFGIGALMLLAVGCTEKLATAADCPALCPGGTATFRDTVITALDNGDTTYSGYNTFRIAPSLLLANGGKYGESRAVIRYYARGDSLQVDSLRPYSSVDSVYLELVPQIWDNTISGQIIDVYRLPYTIDTSATVEDIDAAMTPDRYLQSITLSGTPAPTPNYLLFTGDSVHEFDFTSGDSTDLVIGLRLRSDVPTGVEVGSSTSGSASPSWTTWGSSMVADTLQHGFVQRSVLEDWSVSSPQPVNPIPLVVGGTPASRAFIHFKLPPYLQDTATIVRATLELSLDNEIPGIPGDTVNLQLFNLLGDFGPKSPVLTTYTSSQWLRTGQIGSVSFEAVDLVRSWQGANAFPEGFRLSTPQEAASFTVPAFSSSRSGFGAPRLRITYRTPFPFEGF